MIVYLDSSVVLRVLLRDGAPLEGWGDWQRAHASELLGVEVRRVIDRLRIEGRIPVPALIALHRELSTIEEAIATVRLTRTVLHRAALPMATPTGTLDAIHIATALMLRERSDDDIVFATHDAQQATAAGALGFRVVGS